MKKTQKRVFGLASLALVAVMTVFAAALPSPEVSAVSSTTDTIQIRVVGDTPEGKLLEPADGVTVLAPNQTVKFSHQNAKRAVIGLSYSKDGNGWLTLSEFKSFDLDYETGETDFQIDLDEFGYGKFEFSLTVYGYDGVPVPSGVITIVYAPIIAELEDLGDGTADVVLDYDVTAIDYFMIEVRQQGENHLAYGPIKVESPEKRVNIPFFEFTSKTTNYDVIVIPYDNDGNLVHKTILEYKYKVITPPKTGALFSNLNIAKEDYLITGLLIFFILSVVAFGAITRSRGSKKRK